VSDNDPNRPPQLPPFFSNVEETAMELGAASLSHPFRLLLEMLESYEVRIMVHGVDDPLCTKDYLRGFVHGVRALRSDLLAARAFQAHKLKVQEMSEAKAAQPPFRHPGSGPGGLS
jgi:hypothetical protein